MGFSADEIAAEYGITLSDVYAALAYYYDNKATIDESIQADATFSDELRKVTPSKLPDKLRGRKD